MLVLVCLAFVIRAVDSSKITSADNFYRKPSIPRVDYGWVSLFPLNKSSVSFVRSTGVLKDICNSFGNQDFACHAGVTKIRVAVACPDWTLLNTRPISELEEMPTLLGVSKILEMHPWLCWKD